MVFDLKGNEIQRLLPPLGPDPEEDKPGRYNNVDLLLGFPVKGKPTDVAVVIDAEARKVYLGKDYPKGLLVTQDGDATPEALDEEGEKRDQANFKFTPFDRIIKALDFDF